MFFNIEISESRWKQKLINSLNFQVKLEMIPLFLYSVVSWGNKEKKLNFLHNLHTHLSLYICH